jgi:hypothetical protein
MATGQKYYQFMAKSIPLRGMTSPRTPSALGKGTSAAATAHPIPWVQRIFLEPPHQENPLMPQLAVQPEQQTIPVQPSETLLDALLA